MQRGKARGDGGLQGGGKGSLMATSFCFSNPSTLTPGSRVQVHGLTDELNKYNGLFGSVVAAGPQGAEAAESARFASAEADGRAHVMLDPPASEKLSLKFDNLSKLFPCLMPATVFRAGCLI